MRAILNWHEKAIEALNNGISYKVIENSEARGLIGRYKYVNEDDVLKEYNNINKLVTEEFNIKEEE